MSLFFCTLDHRTCPDFAKIDAGFNETGIFSFIRREVLLNLSFSSQSMENGLHYMAVAFAMQLVKLLLVDERSVSHITEADLFHTIETLMRTCAHSRANAPEG